MAEPKEKKAKKEKKSKKEKKEKKREGRKRKREEVKEEEESESEDIVNFEELSDEEDDEEGQDNLLAPYLGEAEEGSDEEEEDIPPDEEDIPDLYKQGNQAQEQLDKIAGMDIHAAKDYVQGMMEQQEQFDPDEMGQLEDKEGLYPTLTDPKMYMVKCRAGMGMEIVIRLLRKNEDDKAKNRVSKVYSASAMPNSNELIYIEAASKSACINFIFGMRDLFSSKCDLVEISDMPNVFNLSDSAAKPTGGTWARMAWREYDGDLCEILDFDERRGKALIRCVPRENSKELEIELRDALEFYGLRREPEVLGNAEMESHLRDMYKKRVAKRMAEWRGKRPPRLFPIQQLQQWEQQWSESKVHMYATKNMKETYQNLVQDIIVYYFPLIKRLRLGFDPDGYLIKELTPNSLKLNVIPLHAEINTFQALGLPPQEQELINHKNFRPGDAVSVTEGEQTGITGTVTIASDPNSVSIRLDPKYQIDMEVEFHPDHLKKIIKPDIKARPNSQLGAPKSSLSLSTLEKEFQVGNLVKITSSNQPALIIRVEVGNITILKEDNEAIGKSPSDLSVLLSATRSCLDHYRLRVRPGDRLLVIGGPFREKRATAVQIHNNIIWARSREVPHNSGVFAIPSDHIRTLEREPPQKRQARTPGTGETPIEFQTPRSRQGGRGRGRGRNSAPHAELLHQKVKVVKGLHKGLIGIVRSTNQTELRVELQGTIKTVTCMPEMVKPVDAINRDLMTPRSRAGSVTPAIGQSIPWTKNSNTHSHSHLHSPNIHTPGSHTSHASLPHSAHSVQSAAASDYNRSLFDEDPVAPPPHPTQTASSTDDPWA